MNVTLEVVEISNQVKMTVRRTYLSLLFTLPFCVDFRAATWNGNQLNVMIGLWEAFFFRLISKFFGISPKKWINSGKSKTKHVLMVLGKVSYFKTLTSILTSNRGSVWKMFESVVIFLAQAKNLIIMLLICCVKKSDLILVPFQNYDFA